MAQVQRHIGGGSRRRRSRVASAPSSAIRTLKSKRANLRQCAFARRPVDEVGGFAGTPFASRDHASHLPASANVAKPAPQPTVSTLGRLRIPRQLMARAGPLCVALVVTAACGPSGTPTSDSVRRGDAIQPIGGKLGVAPDRSTVHVGDVYGFAFPQMQNRSSHTIDVVSVRLSRVPPGIRVLRYAALSGAQAGGVLLFSRIGTGGVNDYASFPQLPVTKIVLKPHKPSPIYPVVYVKITRHIPRSPLKGCVVTYRQGGKLFEQTLPCLFVLAMR
jgi:hypothetical protein